MAPSQPVLDASVSRLTRTRVLVLAAVFPPVFGYAFVAAILAVVTGIAPHTRFSASGVLTAALSGWLAACQVPVAVGGAVFGALPLLPTLLVIALAARAGGRATVRLGVAAPRDAAWVVGSIAAAHGACGLVVALLQPGRFVEIDPLAAFYYPALIAGLSATMGVLRRGGLSDVLFDRVDLVALRGLVAGAVAVALLLTAGAAVVSFGLLTSIPTTRELFAGLAPGVGDGIGLLLLCLGYLPNAVVAGTAFVAGPGFAIGDVVVSPLEFTGGQVPGLPLLAALPQEQAAWWPVLFVLPLGVGVVVGKRLRYGDERPVARLRGVAVAVGVVAVVFVLLAGSAGGRLGSGPFDPVTMRAAAVSLALVVAVGLPAAVVAWFGGPRSVPDQEGYDYLDHYLDDHADDDDDPVDGPVDGPVDDVVDDAVDGPVDKAVAGAAEHADDKPGDGGDGGGADVPEPVKAGD